MAAHIADLATPALLIERSAMERNAQQMQSACDDAGVELWPHVKTHKLVPVLRRQLALGARGATCAKIGEAEVMLSSGVRRLFIANSLSDLRHAPRLRRLRENLDELILAVTSERQCDVLEQILAEAGISVPVLVAVDTGLGREGARGASQAAALVAKVRASKCMQPIGLYTHEGHAYHAKSSQEAEAIASRVHAELTESAVSAGGGLSIWPGCSVTAKMMVKHAGVKAVRPGTYIFGDLNLTEGTNVMNFDDAALTVLTTVVDVPERELALIDAGSKVLGSDKTTAGIHARAQDIRSIVVNRLSEEHGFLSGHGVQDLEIGQRLRFQPGHVCPVVNLASQVHLVEGDRIIETWAIDARGRSD